MLYSEFHLADVFQVELGGGGDHPLPGAHPGDGGAGQCSIRGLIGRVIQINHLGSLLFPKRSQNDLESGTAGARLQREGRRLALRVGADPPQESDAAQAGEALPPLQQVIYIYRGVEVMVAVQASKVTAHTRWCTVHQLDYFDYIKMGWYTLCFLWLGSWNMSLYN